MPTPQPRDRSQPDERVAATGSHRADQLVRSAIRRTRFTGRAWSLVAIGVVVIACGELFAVAGLRFVGITLVALPVIVLLSRLLWRPRVEVERTVYPTTVTAGDRLRVVAEVRNRSIIGLEPTSYADVVTGTEREVVGGVLPAVASRLHPREGRRRRRIAYGLTGMRRGIQRVGPLLLDNVDGLGLTRRTISVGEPAQIDVWPPIRDVDQLDIPTLRTGSEVDAALGRSGQADDVITREYRRGDALRRVHWRASARAGELRVRQEEHHAEVVALVVLDTALADTRDADAIDLGFELAVSVTASILVRLHELGYDTETRTTRPTEDATGGRLDGTRVGAQESLAPVMHRLMLLAQAGAESESLVAAAGARAARLGRGPLVYIGRTDTPPDPRIHDLTAHADPPIAVLIAPGAGHPEQARRFVANGWQTVVMDSSARDPWARVLTAGVPR